MLSEGTPKTVIAARRRFFQQGGSPGALVSEPILRSWRRCAEHGLDIGSPPRIEPLTSTELREANDRHERLRRLCRPEIEALHADAEATGCLVILTDDTGLVLETLGSVDFAARAARVALRPGVPWNESATGTNAIGTALVEGRAIMVHGGEHYFEPHGILSCSASPIFDPYGRIVGALDLTGPAAVDHRHALGLVRLAVEQIERRFFADGFETATVLRFQTDPVLVGTPREAIVAFDEDRLVAANRTGLQLLGLDRSAMGTARLGALFPALPRGEHAQRLLDGRGREFFGRIDAPPPSPRRREARAPAPARIPAPSGPLFDEATRTAVQRAVKLIAADVPVLVRGETGTGKEVLAREIHRRSARAQAPFVAVNCAAIPENLIEAELFGYEEGAFTGARRQGRKGLLREAEGGIVFLDEIGDMPLALQARLLRVLQEREVAPLGGGRPVRVDFALICATHCDLRAMVQEGRFRADLYFRIAHYTVELPPLRHQADRLGLVRALWQRLRPDHGLTLDAACEQRLAAYEWPGNFRQLAGTLRALAALAEPDRPVGVDALPEEIAGSPTMPLEGPLDTLTREAMRRALDACGGNVSRAARQLGVNRSTLYRRLLHG